MIRFFLGLTVWLAGIAAQAHEVRPSIADIIAADGQVTLEFRLTAEPFLAKVDLNGVQDTNSTAQADAVDRLRALSITDLAAELDGFFPGFIAALDLRAGDVPVALTAGMVETDDIADIAIPRETRFRLEGALPAGADVVSLTWPAQYGVLILRQQGVEEPYTGFLSGGANTGPIQVPGADRAGGWRSFFSWPWR